MGLKKCINWELHKIKKNNKKKGAGVGCLIIPMGIEEINYDEEAEQKKMLNT